MRQAREQGLSLTGPDGLLKQLTKTVVETALDEEMTEHLGYEKHDPAGGLGNIRNGTRAKTVMTGDRPGRDRRASGSGRDVRAADREEATAPAGRGRRDRVVVVRQGPDHGEISAHFAEIYGASVSKETVSRITDRVLEEMQDWASRPLDEVYTAIFIDAIVVKVRDGQVANRPIYAAIGASAWTASGTSLGLWAGSGGEGAKFWMAVLTDLRNRGVRDTFFVVCDGLKGLPEVVGNVWPEATVQTCIIHLIRNTFRLTSRRYWDELKRDLKPIYTAVNATAARAAFDELADKWGRATRRSSGCGTTPGRSSSRSWTTTSRSDECCAARTRSRASTPATGAQSSPRPLPLRTGRDEMPLPGHPITRPHRARQGTMGDALEAGAERVLDHLRRPIPGRGDLLTDDAGNTVSEIDPSGGSCAG